MWDNQDISWESVWADIPDCSDTLQGQNILVTGGTGAFGKAFVRRALDEGAKRVVVFSRDEAKQAAMRAQFNDPRLRFMLGSVSDYNRVSEACRGVDIVVHAAAQKRVETCEENPWQAVETNVHGTQAVARACIASGVRRAVLLSTDKAAAPNTLYGATKLTAERIWCQANVYSAGTKTKFSATRYGNVVGSTGSVVPIWKAQKESGVISITDKGMTRFFMGMDEAVDLVVLAIRNMRGGELFVPKIGKARITELAEAVAPGCALREIGIRPGEKLHETLLTADEARLTYDCGTHYVVEPESRTWGNVPRLVFPKVPEGFEYRSDTAPNIPEAELQRMAA